MSDIAAMPSQTYFYTQETTQGSWWNRQQILQVRFSADSFDEFIQHFDQMAGILALWQKKYGKRAKLLNIEILAHPWILQRVLQRLKGDAGREHGYGDFCRYGTVILHLFDPLDQVGQHYTLYDKGQIPQVVQKD